MKWKDTRKEFFFLAYLVGGVMTSRERVQIAMSRIGKPDRPPFEISWGAFTPKLMRIFREQTGSNLTPDEFFDFDTRSVTPDPTTKDCDFSRWFSGIELDEFVRFNDWGVGSVPTEYEIPDFKYHPLASMETVSEIESYDWPDIDKAYRYESLAGRIEELHARGYAVNGEMYQTIFETAWLMRDMNQFLVDMYLNQPLIEAMLERMSYLRIEQAKHFAKAGVDVIRLGDDIVTQRGLLFSKEFYRKFFKPTIKKIVEEVKSINPEVLVFMHSCGKIEEMIPEYIDCGIDILNPVQPECNNLTYIEKEFGNDIAFWGGLGVQSVLPNGTVDEVRKAVLDTQTILGKKGSWLAAPAHILDPTIPWENIIAFVDAAKNATY